MSKAGRPNLSLAGKREAPAQQKTPRGGSTANRGARGRGGRGRGGGTGPRQKQDLIQTGGVFSEGLGGDFPSRKKDKDVDSAQFSFSRREKGSGGPSSSADSKSQEKSKTPVNSEGKASFEGWEALWCSDDEGDLEEMRALRPEGFISDLRRGTIMPVVLPLEDQPQFRNVLNKASRLSLEEDDTIEDEKKPGPSAATAQKSSQPTPEQLISMLESSTTELLHLQLPSVIGSICNHAPPPDAVPMEVDDPDAPPMISPPPVPQYNLPQSHRIGKLQVTRKGRLLLQIGGHSIDITSKPTTGKQQGTVLLEVEPNSEPQPANFFGGAPAPKFNNALYHLGNVKHNLVGSMTWGELNDGEKKHSEDVEGEEEKKNQMDTSEGVAEEKKQVEELEKVQTGWNDLAEKWAKGQFASS